MVWIALGALSAACAVGAFDGPHSGVALSPTSKVTGMREADAASIAVLVLDDDGEPIVGAHVFLLCHCMDEPVERTTNQYGVAGFRNAPAGRYTVQAMAGHGDVTVVVDLPDKTVANVRIHVSPNASIT